MAVRTVNDHRAVRFSATTHRSTGTGSRLTAPGIGIAKPTISFISAVPHATLDLVAAHADVFEPVIVHRRKLPHVAADAQVIRDRGYEAPPNIEQGDPRPVGSQSLQEGASQGPFHGSLAPQGHVRCLDMIVAMSMVK
jgi:hypothetical protein